MKNKKLKVKLLSHEDFGEIKKEIEKGNKNFLYITATVNLKGLRLDQDKDKDKKLFKAYSSRKIEKNNLDFNLCSFDEFTHYVRNLLRHEGGYISTIDQRAILYELIKKHYSKERLYQTLVNEFFELYQFFMFKEVEKINDNALYEIKKNYPEFYYNIFQLYNYFKDELSDIKNGKPSIAKVDIEKLKNKDPYIVALKRKISEILNNYAFIFFDGFLFFNDHQYFVIHEALSLGKEVYLIAKSNILDSTESIILSYYEKLFDLDVTKLITQKTNSLNDFETNDSISWLQTARENFLKDTTFPKKDDSIVIYEPFYNREEEFKFVIRKITEIIKENLKPEDNLKEQLKNLLKDFAIVNAVDKEKFEEELDLLLQRYGVFLLDSEADQKEEWQHVDLSSVDKIYYSEYDFLRTPVKNKDGTELSFKDKLRFFRENFERIYVIRRKRPVSSYPVTQFIVQLCEIILKGIDVDKFKIILYSNWKYISGRDVKWSDYLFQFRMIQEYFRNSNDISAWLEALEKIQEEKKNLLQYKGHPFSGISDDFLKNMRGILEVLKKISEDLKDIQMNIRDYIKNVGKYLFEEKSTFGLEGYEFEEELISRIRDTLNEISISSYVSTDAAFFAKNLMALIEEFRQELEEVDEDLLYLNVVNLENMHKFKYVFFVMAENDKYPRPLKRDFPFSQDIIEIVEKHGICEKPMEMHDEDYHLKLERYLFKNVLDFTGKRIYFTYSQREGEKELGPSIFLEDLTSILGKEGMDISSVSVKAESTLDVDGKLKNIDLDELVVFEGSLNKEEEPIDRLLYKYCKKLFYYRNFCEDGKHLSFFNDYQLSFYASWFCFSYCLRKHGQRYKNKVYTVHDDEYYSDLEKFIIEGENNLRRWFFLWENNKFKFIWLERYVKSYLSKLIGRIVKKGINNFYVEIVGDDYYVKSVAKETGYIRIPLFNYLEFAIISNYIWNGKDEDECKRRYKEFYCYKIDKDMRNFKLKMSALCVHANKVGCLYCEIRDICKLTKLKREE